MPFMDMPDAVGRLYQNILQWEGKVFLNYRRLQGQGIKGQNRRAKDVEGIPSDTSKRSWDLQSRRERGSRAGI